MTFELFEKDYEVLHTHARLAAESGSMSGSSAKKFELEARYITSQISQLYDYFIEDNGIYLTDHGGRSYGQNVEKRVFKLSLPTHIAERYYHLQHRYDRGWVLNALINIYEHRQNAIEQRDPTINTSGFRNFRYPFNPKEWGFSYLGCTERGIYKGYHIDVKEPILRTVEKYLRLTEIAD